MTYGNDTVTLRDAFTDFLKNKSELKKYFEEYITDIQFPLELRWQMFLDAPRELSNEKLYLYKGLNFLDREDNFSGRWYQIYDTERGYKIDLVEFVETLEECDEEELEDTYPGFQSFKEPDIIDKIKEQLMKDNIKSFIFD
jgi:heme oxygenase